MENLASLINQQNALSTREQTTKFATTLEALRSQSSRCAEVGVNALDLIGSKPVSSVSLAAGKVLLQQNYGIEIPKEKWMMLVSRILDEQWTEERFQMTLSWFIQNKKYPSWVVADWFDFGIRLYPFAWVRKHCKDNGIREDHFIATQLDVYLVNGVRCYKYKDGVTLQLEREQVKK